MVREQIDLHGLSVNEAVKTFISRCNRLFVGGYRGKIVVVHGYGSSGQGGAIKERLNGFLKRHADAFDAPSWDGGNPGVTTLRQLRLLPAPEAGGMCQQLLDFLQVPKTEAKILAKFQSRPAAEVKDLIRELRVNGLVHEVTKNGQKAWQAVAGHSGD